MGNKKNIESMYRVDIGCVSNGIGATAYGGSLEAYSFKQIDCEQWFESYFQEIYEALGKKHLPVYRIADGEMRFLFGLKVDWKKDTVKSIARYAKYEYFKSGWKTSWGEKYSTKEFKELNKTLKKCIAKIAEKGRLAIYWNENALNNYTEYNRSIQKLFAGFGVELNDRNYIPFHFGPGLLAIKGKRLLKDRKVLVISGFDMAEFETTASNLKKLGAGQVYFHQCSATEALKADYTVVQPEEKVDLVLVAAGIGAAKILSELDHLNCPVLDIGGYIHVLSGKRKEVHADFFRKPLNN